MSTRLCVVATVVHLAGLATHASAQCVIFENPADLFARADVVFVGTVVGQHATGEGGAHLVDIAIATFRVEQSWKGSPAREVQVGADKSFQNGGKYLVFAAGNPLSTSIMCRWAELIEPAAAKLEWLAKLPSGAADGQSEDPLKDLTNAEALWRSKKPKSYEFTIQVRCYCVGLSEAPPSFRVTESGSIAVSELDRVAFDAYDRYNTIEKLFAAIRRTLNFGRYKVAVQYDSDLGYPVVADLDPRRDAADDELFFRVTKFRSVAAY
jgi:uncharacterized protein DUF6174